jgi:hypothetical protein
LSVFTAAKHEVERALHGRTKESLCFYFKAGGSFCRIQLGAGCHISIGYDNIKTVCNVVESNWKLKKISVPEKI